MPVKMRVEKMIENGTLLQNRYLIEKRIAVGGMGAVYRAIDQRFDNSVAIKETLYKEEELREAFEREARLLNSLLHPVLPHVSDYFTENNSYFLVMQFIEGEDLSKIIKREGAFPVKDVLRWIDNLLDALDYLHLQEPPIIHRDIKPQNLKITPRGDVILLDFGLAKLKHEDTSGVKSVFGYSQKYSPLEQIQGTGTDARSDIFSLGATAYCLLTGKPPIEVLARATQIIAGQPDPLRLASEINDKVPMKVAAVLHSALALNPEQRFVSAKAMRQALEYARKASSSENTGESTERALAAVAAGDHVVSPVETENFPALEAFVDEVKNSPQANENLVATVEVPIQNVKASLPAGEELPQSAAFIDAPTKTSFQSDQPRFRATALAVLLVIIGLAAGLIIYSADSSEKTSATPIAESSPEFNEAQTATISDSFDPKISETTPLEDVEQARNSPIRPVEKTIEKPETSKKGEVIDEPRAEAVVKEKPKPTLIENSRRGKHESTGETRSRVVESEPVPDIESVFTGRSSWETNKKQKPKQEREQMSDEEWQELRRQRREQSKKNQNGNPFPF